MILQCHENEVRNPVNQNRATLRFGWFRIIDSLHEETYAYGLFLEQGVISVRAFAYRNANTSWTWFVTHHIALGEAPYVELTKEEAFQNAEKVMRHPKRLEVEHGELVNLLDKHLPEIVDC